MFNKCSYIESPDPVCMHICMCHVMIGRLNTQQRAAGGAAGSSRELAGVYSVKFEPCSHNHLIHI